MNIQRVLFLFFLACAGFGINPAQSAEVSLSPSVVASGRDDGPADGAFDSFTENSGGVVWNGFTEFRVVAEIDITSLSGPITTATLIGRLGSNASRGIRVDTYTGKGAIELADFSQDQLVGEEVFPSGTSDFDFELTTELRNAIANGDDFLGIVIRESPECPDSVDCLTMNVSPSSLQLQVTSPEPSVGPIFQDRFEPIFQDCIDCPTMIKLRGGIFVQGSPTSELQSSPDERPERTLSISSFAISLTEVTFAQWDACIADGGCSHNPSDSGWGRGDRPVIDVNWNDAQEYVAWLTTKTGRPYRLPSESEWEFATRAGTIIGRFNTGDCITSDQANFLGAAPALGCERGFARRQTLPVKSFSPNDFGLYDTHGNVWEWVLDCWNSDYNGAPRNGSAWTVGDCSRAVLRGGGWNVDGNSLRSANRLDSFRDIRSNSLGFRVAMAMPRVFQDCKECPRMVMVPGGTFTQGTETEQEERPVREVTISNPFAIGQTEVTFDEWDACVADGGCTHVPSDRWGRGDQPVIFVSWNDAQEYVTWLSNKTGQGYRLPSESEWEYATRAGTTGRFNTGDCITTDQANFEGESPATGCPTGVYVAETLPVGSFAPNAFGLYDTHGNVWEWVQDCWNEDYVGAPTNGSVWLTGDCSLAVLRGGAWFSQGFLLRSAFRSSRDRRLRLSLYGFRVARSVALGP